MPANLRPLLLAFYSTILLAIAAIASLAFGIAILLIWLLTRLRWISPVWGKVGTGLLGAIALVRIPAMLYLFRIEIWCNSYSW